MTMDDVVEAILATRRGVALVATGEASGRLDEAAQDIGALLCLVGHAMLEERRGTDGGRLDELVATSPGWLRDATARFVAATDLDWWSRSATTAVHRQVADGMTGLELTDRHGRARSLPEEATPHLHTFQTVDHRRPVRRWRPDPGVEVALLDGPEDWDAAGRRVPTGVDGVHLTLRGLLTIEPPARVDWPWETGGVLWHTPVPGTPLPHDETGSWPHDHDWVGIGREFDPRFDEGDEIVGSVVTR